MKLNLFGQKHFEEYRAAFDGNDISRQDAFIKITNQILNDYIESLPLVYSQEKLLQFTKLEYLDSSHQARLICIEPIEKKDECTHKSPYINQDNMAMDIHTQVGARHIKHGEIICLNCGKKLKARWEIDE